MPLTPNGKIDRRALQALDVKPSDLTRSFVAPRTTTEKTIAEIWERALGVERVGANDNFFELGGHSLLATQIVSRLRERFQTPLPLRDLLTSPTVAGLAERVENARWARQAPHVQTAAEGVEEIEL
jgi:acyl carrier protein